MSTGEHHSSPVSVVCRALQPESPTSQCGVLHGVPVPGTTLPPSPPSPAQLRAHVHGCGKVSLLSAERTSCRLLVGARALCLQLIPYGEKAVLKHGQTTDGQLTPSRDRCKWDNHSEGQRRLGSEQAPSAMGLPVHCRASASSLASTSGTLHSVSTRCQMPPEEHHHLWVSSSALQCYFPLSCTWSSKFP